MSTDAEEETGEIDFEREVERQFKKASFTVARIWIRPVSFAAWCKERNVSPDQAARLIFANEAARCPRAQP
jgi:hypothetical protein